MIIYASQKFHYSVILYNSLSYYLHLCTSKSSSVTAVRHESIKVKCGFCIFSICIVLGFMHILSGLLTFHKNSVTFSWNMFVLSTKFLHCTFKFSINWPVAFILTNLNRKTGKRPDSFSIMVYESKRLASMETVVFNTSYRNTNYILRKRRSAE